MTLQRVAIANRGEVAVRIIRACEELGLETLLLHSEADISTRAYRMASKTVCIGGPSAQDSYLNIEANIQGAIAGGAQGIHPGFGFLSENAQFAEACQKANLLFIGPPAQAIRALGDKVNCKKLAQKLELPLLPGYDGEKQKVEDLIGFAQAIGFPVIVKAAAGGGGRGMKLIREVSSAREQIESAQREALSAFGSAQVFLEKYLDRAKHIEFQVFVDASGKARHFLERECSVQRRHQKIIEEALSPSLDEDLRQKMSEAACKLVEVAGYRGAGTVEFLLQDEEYFLLEVNTRLQVEHPVTEMVLGVDLVKAQILTAQGKAAFATQAGEPLMAHGHAIECRIYAENPFLGGVPSIGKLGMVYFPEGPGRRFEYGFEAGDEVTTFYDSMIAKVIVWDETRSRCIQKMLRVLQDTVIFGVHTNIPLLQQILQHPEFLAGRMTTRFFEKFFPGALSAPPSSELKKAAIQAAVNGWSAMGNQGLEGVSPSSRMVSPYFGTWGKS